MTNAVATRRCSTRTGSSIRVNRDAKRVNRVRVFFGETENVSKFGAPCARRTVYGDSLLPELENGIVRKCMEELGDSLRGEMICLEPALTCQLCPRPYV